MPKEYQRTKNNPYWMPRHVYMQIVYLVRDYDRMKAEADEILYATPDIQTGSVSEPGNPTENKALKIAEMTKKVDAIDAALRMIPQGYRKGVFNNVAYSTRYPSIAGMATWARWRAKLLWYIAKKLYFL